MQDYHSSNASYRTYLLARWIYGRFLERCDTLLMQEDLVLKKRHKSFEDLPEETVEAYLDIARGLLKILRRDHTVEDLEHATVVFD